MGFWGALGTAAKTMQDKQPEEKSNAMKVGAGKVASAIEGWQKKRHKKRQVKPAVK